MTERVGPGPALQGLPGEGRIGSQGRAGVWVPGWGGHKTGRDHAAGSKEEGPPSGHAWAQPQPGERVMRTHGLCTALHSL